MCSTLMVSSGFRAPSAEAPACCRMDMLACDVTDAPSLNPDAACTSCRDVGWLVCAGWRDARDEQAALLGLYIYSTSSTIHTGNLSLVAQAAPLT